MPIIVSVVWFYNTFHQSTCIGVLEVANNSVGKLRDIVDPRHFCARVTQPRLLAMLKKTFIEPTASGVALRDHILSMDTGFEFLLNNRGSRTCLDAISTIYNLCTGKEFSPSYTTDSDFVSKLAQVCMHIYIVFMF
jgi:hypothetical protein